MPEKLVVDSSTLVAIERAGLSNLLGKINFEIIIPRAVKEEIKSEHILKFVSIMELRGRTLKISRSLEHLNIGKGEAQCCALANKLGLKFIVSDDMKFIRQKYFSDSRSLHDIKILGFSFFLHIFYQKKLISSIWEYFDKIIKLNNWERSETLVANYTFLKELGY